MEMRLDTLRELWREDATMARALRAAGMPEACLAGEWSDYDTLEALCAALPQMAGHPQAARLAAWLRETTACDLPACAENAPALWQSYVYVHGYGVPVCLPDEYTPVTTAPDADPPVVLYVPSDDGCLSWKKIADLMATASADKGALAALSDGVARWLDERLIMPPRGEWSVSVWLGLPQELPFVRPDPYHAGLALQAVARGESLSDSDRALLTAQLARAVGQGMTRRSATSATLVLTGGDADAVLALCRYLDGCGGLPPTVWLAESPADAATLCGQFAAVRTGLSLNATDTAEHVKNKLATYATAAPLGRIVLGVPAWASHLDVTIADVYSAVLSDIE